MKKGKLWTALLLTAAMCVNPVWTQLPDNASYDKVSAEEGDSDTEGDTGSEEAIDPTVISGQYHQDHDGVACAGKRESG